MKLTREQLQKIIQEELAVAIEEGELDEGFLDRLFGKEDRKIGDFATEDEVERKINIAHKALVELYKSASSQLNVALKDRARQLSGEVLKLKDLKQTKPTTPPPNPEQFGKDTRTDPRINSRRIGESKRKSSK